MYSVKIDNVYHIVSGRFTLCGLHLPPNVMLDEKHRHPTSCLKCNVELKKLEKRRDQ